MGDVSDIIPDDALTASQPSTRSATSDIIPDSALTPAISANGQTQQPETGTQHLGKIIDTAKAHPFTLGVGMAENALAGVTGGAGDLYDAVTGSPPQSQHWFMYQPKTQAGKELAAEGGAESEHFLNMLPDTPAGQTLKERIPQAIGATTTAAGVLGGLKVAGRPEPPPILESAGPIEQGHPLTDIAESEAQRLQDARQAGITAGMKLPERATPPTVDAANSMIRDELNLPEGAPVTSKVVTAGIKQNAVPRYNEIRQVQQWETGPQFKTDMDEANLDLIPEKYRPPVDGTLSGQQAVDFSQDLRARAKKYFAAAKTNPENDDIAQAHWDAAQAIEDETQRHLESTGQGKKAADWDDARVYAAKANNVLGALDGAGNVVVPSLKRQMLKNRNMTGNIEQLATLGAMYPDMFKATPAAPAPGLARRAAAAVTPTVSTGLGALVGGTTLGPVGATGGALTGKIIGEDLAARMRGQR